VHARGQVEDDLGQAGHFARSDDAHYGVTRLQAMLGLCEGLVATLDRLAVSGRFAGARSRVQGCRRMFAGAEDGVLFTCGKKRIAGSLVRKVAWCAFNSRKIHV